MRRPLPRISRGNNIVVFCFTKHWLFAERKATIIFGRFFHSFSWIFTMLRRYASIGLLLSLLSILLVVPVKAQRPSSLKPTVFALRDAKVVTAPGNTLAKATVVIRDGLIEAVGEDVKVPADALVIDCAGLTIYSGFIDALSTWGFDNALRRSEGGAAAAEDLASDALAATKADNRKGMTPEFIVGTALSDDQQADEWRKLGFTAHLIAPDGGMIVGQSALVSLSGGTARDAVLRSPFAQHVAFRIPAGNEYPRSLMGVVAHCRQTLLDAGHYARLWSAYEAAGRAGKRPPLDLALAALATALDGKQPVVFEAEGRDGVHRALDFAAEFKLKPILAGGRDAWKAVDRLEKEHVPVLLRMQFTEGMPGRPGRIAAVAAATPDADAEKALPNRVKEDRERLLKEEQQNASVLHNHKILFAFSSQGMTGEKPWEKFKTNLKKVVDAGLPADAALAALTIDAAKILGVDKQLGTIVPGKAAHLVVMDGPFTEAATQVRYVFADGNRFEYDAKKAEKPKPGDTKDTKKPEEKTADNKDAKSDEKPDPATEIAADRKPTLKLNGNALIKGATILTAAREGRNARRRRPPHRERQDRQDRRQSDRARKLQGHRREGHVHHAGHCRYPLSFRGLGLGQRVFPIRRSRSARS